jgi:large subunit ribosomal protein L18
MYAQIIDDGDEKGSRTLVAASTVGQESYGGNCEAARQVGKTLAERALGAGIQKVAFDRREYRYHGRVAALADAARDAGLDLGPKKVVPEKPEPKAKAKAKSKKSKSQAKK